MVSAADVDETPRADESPEDLVRRLSLAKARWVSERAGAPGEVLIIAADTVVVLDGTILGKPCDAREAVAMLRSLSGRSHRVVTGFCVLAAPESRVAAVSTEVSFRELNLAVIERYVATGEPLDKAGGYGIQAGGGALVLAIRGSYTNVVGLPLAETLEVIAELGGPKL